MTVRSAQLDDELFDSYPLRVSDDTLVRYYGAEAVAWSSQGSTPAYLDPVATLVWQLLDEECTVSEIVDDVYEVLGLPRPIVRNQMRRIVALLEESALLATAAARPPRPTESMYFRLPPNP